jgi:hypothetical protein
LFSGIRFIHDSYEEHIAIFEYNRQRAIKFLAPLIAAASPEKREDIVKKYRGLIYPEEGYEDAEYVKKANTLFEKIKNIDLFVNKM